MAIPPNLHAAYEWTRAAGELSELARLRDAELRAYAIESAANAREHGEHVSTIDLLELADLLRVR